MHILRPALVHMLNLSTTTGFTCCYLQASRLHDHPGHNVGIHVRGRAAVFEIAVLLSLRIPGNPNGAATIRDTVGELIDGSGLVRTCQTPLISLAVCIDVLFVTLLQLLYRVDDLGVRLAFLVSLVAR